MHLGRTNGAGAAPLGGDAGTDGADAEPLGCDTGTDGAGTELFGRTETKTTGALSAGCVLEGAIDFVQIVELTVLKTVDTI